ncbi:MAG: ABC transporter permease [Ruminococcaceae bacterium]|nr:ABC transporter permease [Oscillospiraceae bacterium]
MKKQKSIFELFLPIITFASIIIIWAVISASEALPSFMLPSPLGVIKAFKDDFSLLISHSAYTLAETFLGMVISIILSFTLSVIMDRFSFIKKAVYPLLVVTQTIPSIAIAPLLVLWFGFGMSPKIILIVIVCFFPLAVGFLDGFSSADRDEIKLLQSMGANTRHIFRHVKLPRSLPHFFAGLKVSSSYCIVSAVISEWLGGTVGLGVYMTRVRKSYAFDKMFAVIILVSVLSILLMALISLLEKMTMPYNKEKIK